MRKLFYEDKLPIKNSKIDWNNCINLYIYFIYDNLNGYIRILEYKKYKYIKIQYEDIVYDILIENFLECKLGKMLFYKYNFSIGDVVNSNYGSITILDRYIEFIGKQNQKIYKYQCNSCNYIGTKTEHDLQKYKSCSCCSGKITVEGINDIPTTDPWMIPYFQGGYDEAKLYSSNSCKKVKFKCPHCGKVSNKLRNIYQLFASRTLNCQCSDGMSYPNKFASNLLEQLNIDFIPEYSPNWVKPKRYDFYFELDNKKYILEMDGGLGHGNNTFGKINKISDSIKNDIYKDNKARMHDIHIIRIDCIKSHMEYIKQNILNSEMSKVFDLSNIQWQICEQNALKNIVKEICDYVKINKFAKYDQLSKIFKISKCTIGRYLKLGLSCGFIDNQLYEEYISIVKKRNRKISVFDINYKLLKQYNSATEFINNSVKDFGITTSSGGITKSIENNTIYKGLFKLKYE